MEDLENGLYTIKIANRWDMLDLSEFPRIFVQVYSFLYASQIESDASDAERSHRAFINYPWKGGYSAVNFYMEL